MDDYYCHIALDVVGPSFVIDTDKRYWMVLNIDEHLFVVQFSWYSATCVIFLRHFIDDIVKTMEGPQLSSKMGTEPCYLMWKCIRVRRLYTGVSCPNLVPVTHQSWRSVVIFLRGQYSGDNNLIGLQSHCFTFCPMHHSLPILLFGDNIMAMECVK
jgi:hypothetical protein